MKENKINWNRIKYFKLKEFVCPCCQKSVISEELVLKLDLAREIAEVPFRINSAYRCQKHNHLVGGVKDSAHLLGLAVDIFCLNGIDRIKILRGLIISGFRRIGIGKTFIHVDIDSSKPNNLWLYEDK